MAMTPIRKPAGAERTMPKPLGAALFGLAIVLFLIANRGAYEGYFHGDELDNIFWTRHVQLPDYARAFVTPRYFLYNFRPAGHLWWNLMARHAQLDFRWYVAVIHALHLMNVLLVWFLLRRLGLGLVASAAGSLFFAFHMAVFSAYWKPMYVFDVLCATFTILSVLAYTRTGEKTWSWALAASFVFFWLAYKSKEMAVMLPAALALYEYWLGGRNWKRLVPFFLVSLSFSLQALLIANPTRDNDYTLRFAPAEVWRSVAFYSSKLFFIPYAGLAVLALPFAVRDRRAWLGVAGFCLLLLPMLFLSRRLFGAYLYVPIAWLAVAFATVAARFHPALVAAFFALWIPWNYSQLRANRREALSLADENRRYVTKVREVVRANPKARFFAYDGVPESLHSWGIAAAVRYFYDRNDIEVFPIEEVNLEKILKKNSGVVLLSWDPAHRELSAFSRPPGAPEPSYIFMHRGAPVWQLGEGWLSLTGQFRWTRPRATARLHRPAGAAAFELVVNMGEGPPREPLRASVFLDGRLIGSRSVARGSGFQTLRWSLPEAPPGPARIEFRAEPPYEPDGSLGLPISAFGFLPREKP